MNKKTMLRLGLLLVLSVFIFSCAGLRFSAGEPDILKTVELINSGTPEEILQTSNTPFLLDREIILIEKDLMSMWSNFRNAGFKIINPVVAESRLIDENTYKEFSDSMEVKAFFNNYLAGNILFVKIKAKNGVFLMLIGRIKKGYPVIFGFKGPV